MRAAVGIGLMLGSSIYFNVPDLAFGVIAYFWACLVDPGGPIQSRLKIMGWFGGFSTAVITLASYGAYWGSVAGGVTLFLLVLMCGLTRTFATSLGPGPAQGGFIAAVAVVVGVATDRDIWGAMQLGGFFLVGVACNIALSLYVWPIKPQKSARQALIAILSRLDEMLRALTDLDRAANGADQRWLHFDTRYQHAARLLIERTRQTVEKLDRDKDRYLDGIDASGRVLGAIVALSHERRQSMYSYDPDFECRLLLDLRRALSAVMQQIGGDLEVLDQIRDLLTRARATETRAGRPVAYACEALILLAISWTQPPAGLDKTFKQAKFPSFTLDPMVVRHASRVSVAVSVSYCLGIWFDIPFWFWGAIATLVVMQPLPGNTWLRVLERAAGSLIGEVAAAVLITSLSGPVEMAFAIVPLSAAVVAVRLVNYGFFVVFLTPMFIMLSDYIQPSDGLIVARLLNEFAGACLGIGAAFFLWPEKEVDEVPKLISQATSASMSFAIAAVNQGSTPSQDLSVLQRQSGLACTRVETARERLWLQGRFKSAKLVDVSDIAVALRSVCGASTILEINGAKASNELRAAKLDEISRDLQRMIAADGVDPGIPFEQGEDDLGHAVNTLVETVKRYLG